MNKRFCAFILLCIISASTTNGNQIYYFNSSIEVTEYNHVTFMVHRDVDISIEGVNNGIVGFLALDEVNYINWLNLTTYTQIYYQSLSGEFQFQFIVTLPVNSTLHMIFHNAGNSPVQMEVTIDEIISTINESPFPIIGIITGLSLIILLYKKSLQS